MSGGRFDYCDSQLKSLIFGYDDKCINRFEDKEISQLVFDVLDLIHDYDWYDSGDTCEETWLKKKAAFKKKWLRKNSEPARTKQIIDESIESLRKELYSSFCDLCPCDSKDQYEGDLK